MCSRILTKGFMKEFYAKNRGAFCPDSVPKKSNKIAGFHAVSQQRIATMCNCFSHNKLM